MSQNTDPGKNIAFPGRVANHCIIGGGTMYSDISRCTIPAISVAAADVIKLY
ncbi:MAG: hypothetical protein WCF03_18005 [Nitrososphaeraceae archaeon]